MQPVNPKPFLKGLVNHRVGVKLKFNSTEYRGTLVSTDNYFNLQLNEAEEFVAGVSHGTLGEIFIRCNNVLYIRGAAELRRLCSSSLHTSIFTYALYCNTISFYSTRIAYFFLFSCFILFYFSSFFLPLDFPRMTNSVEK
ncbi:AFH_G0023230.mRNA.1.CDS.1 [Saccharomyces cerevisiae]|nr:AFH_G0023230.mRNA.1.CDS.1 [Saccharomyces cerevisiae]CAI6725865.1 AFH_G0023230.mRNA.1.CDS.1 [Saccharomyces cerevisiae]